MTASKNKILKNHNLKLLVECDEKKIDIAVKSIVEPIVSLKTKSVSVNGIQTVVPMDQLQESPKIEIETDSSINDFFFCGTNSIKLAIEKVNINTGRKNKKLIESDDCFFADRKTLKAVKGDLVTTSFSIHFRSLTIVTEEDDEPLVNLKYDPDNLIIEGKVIYGEVNL